MTSPNITASPDLAGYVDLRVFDLSDQDIVAAAIVLLQLNLPGFIPREGDSEIVILESIALEISEAIVAVNRLPGAVIQALLLLAGVDKDFGAAPTATVTITVADTNGYTIPAGTQIYCSLEDGTSVKFLVESPGLVIAPGDFSGTVSVIADEFTAKANGMPAGTRLAMADPLPFIDSAELATGVADGTNPETDGEWRDRGVARLSRLSDALVVPRHFEAAALERPEVARAVGIDLYDPSVGPAPGDNPGHMTVAVLGENGAPLSTEAKDAIRVAMEDRAVAVLDVHVIDVVITVVDFTAEIAILPGFEEATVIASVEDAINTYVDPMTWAWGGTIRRNELISLIDRVGGVDYVVDVSIDADPGDYVIVGAANLPNAGTILVTVS